MEVIETIRGTYLIRENGAWWDAENEKWESIIIPNESLPEVDKSTPEMAEGQPTEPPGVL